MDATLPVNLSERPGLGAELVISRPDGKLSAFTCGM